MRVLLCLLLLVVAACWSFGAEYRLVERLGHAWTSELVSFSAAFKRGEGKAIVTVTADGTPVPFQVAEATTHADGSLQSARVYVHTDLAPKATITFKAFTERQQKPAVLPPTDLRVARQEGRLLIGTAAGGVALPLGDFTAPEIPAPIQGMLLTSGRWIGGSTLLGTPAPTALTSELVAEGPLFAEARLTYTYPNEKRYHLVCRVIAGQPVVVFSERSDVEKGRSYYAKYNDDFKRFVQGRVGYKASIAESHWVRVSLAGFTPTPTSLAWVEGTHTDITPETLGKDPWLATLFPWYSWNGGALSVPLADATDGLGLMALNAGRWVRPMENMGLVKQEGKEFFVQWPINDGAREWGLFFGTPTALAPTGEERNARQYPGLDRPSPLRLARIKHGELNLETVNGWHLAWKDARPVPNPVSINPPGKLREVRERIMADPMLAKHAEGVVSAWETLRKSEKHFPFTLNWVMTPDGVEDAYLATGTAQYARELYDLTIARLRYYSDQTLSGVGYHGYRASHSYGMFHLAPFLVGASRQADLLLGAPEITTEEKADLRAQLAFFGHLFTDANYWPCDEIGKGTYNMYASRDGVLGVLGSVLAGHPRAAAWQAIGKSRLEDVLAHFIYPSGAMLEGLHYSGVTLDFNLPFMAMLKLAGGTDYFADERLKKGLRWYASSLPPSDPRFKRAYMPPFGYSHPSNTSQSVRWAVAAAMTAKTDPEFAKLMMRTWRQSGSLLTMVVGEAGYRSAFSLGLVDPSLPSSDGRELSSAKWESFGAVLRNGADSPHETFMAISTGVPGGFRIYPNEGTFHLYAKGAPLCLRFGTRAFNAIGTMQAWMNNRITLDRRDECTGDTGKIAAWASLPTADLFTGAYRFTRLAARAPLTAKEPGNMELSEPRIVNTKLAVGKGNGFYGDQQDVPPQFWQRGILFVKDADPLGPNYFLIRDSFQATFPSDWNLWCLADDLKVDGERATFAGKFGVDLDVALLTPARKRVTGAWGPDWERQQLLQLQQGMNEGYFALLYPRTKEEPIPTVQPFADGAGARLALPGRTDWAFLAPDRVAVTTDEVTFTGRAGVAQRGADWMRLTLLDGDSIGCGDFLLMHGRQVVEDVRAEAEGALAFSAALLPGPRLAGDADGGPRVVVIKVPLAYQALHTFTINGHPATLQRPAPDTYRFSLPEGRHTFEITR